MTERLYYDNSYLTQFEAECVETQSEDERILIRLNRTAFYPTSGGQRHDTGFLNNVPVVDVFERKGEVWHVVDRPITCGPVVGKIDWARRFDFMQQHTGFHLLAGAFRRVFQVDTLSSHLGEEIATIDVSLNTISEETVRKVEEQANQVIAENRPVRAFWVGADELEALELRKQPAAREKIRLVEIRDFDLDPCGGTHVRQTAEVQLVKILRWEKLRGNLRLYFLAGGRAVRSYTRLWQLVRRLNRELTAGENELLERVRDLKDEIKSQKKRLQALKDFWVEQQTERLKKEAYNRKRDFVVFRFENEDFADVKTVAQKLTREAKLLTALFSEGEKNWRLILAAPEKSKINLRTWLEDLRTVSPVKGGGRPTWVEVIGDRNLDQVAQLIDIKMKSKE